MAELFGAYDRLFVAISVIVAVFSSFVALATVPRIYCSSNAKWDTLWSIVFGVSLGTGIWSMHFIGMMAFNLPVPIYYDITLTALSLLLSITVCAIAVLPLRGGGAISATKIFYMGAVVGSGVAGMHYVGIAAMRMDVSIHYSPPVVLLSIAIAIIAASAALFIANHLRTSTIFSQMKLKVAAATVMGFAVSSMHYTAMIGMQFFSKVSSQDVSTHIEPHFLAASVVLIAILVQGGTLLVALLDEAYFATRKLATLANQRSEIDQTLFSILDVAVEHRPLNEILEHVLHTLLNIDWLSIEKKGAIFIARRGTESLHMAAHKNLDPSLLETCSSIAFGTCLYGQVAQSYKPKSSVDHDDVIQPEGMSPHGHICVPIRDEKIVLGVISLYLKHGHESSPLELQFLNSVSNAIAGIIERNMIEEKLKKMSYEDELTGLPNRRKFSETFEHALDIANRTKGKLAVMMLDLDRFKPVNDTFGHDVGDILLQQVAQRVLTCLRDMDTFARVGGDEFIILLEMIDMPDSVVEIGTRVLDELKRPFEINGRQIEIGGSIGASIYPDDALLADELIKQADISLYKAKETRGTMQINT